MGLPYGVPLMATQSQPEPQPIIPGSTTLAVTNLPYRIRWQDLKDLFRRFGTPSRADVFLAPDGRSRGVGMVSMSTRSDAERCVQDLNGYEWYGRKIGVKIDETGGHQALAAAAMAGATFWEGLGTQEYEVCTATGALRANARVGRPTHRLSRTVHESHALRRKCVSSPRLS
jgi:RNA recognition motif